VRRILNQDTIIKEIERQIKGGNSYLDAIVDYCEKNNLELESVGEILKKSPILKEKIKREAKILLMIKGETNGI